MLSHLANAHMLRHFTALIVTVIIALAASTGSIAQTKAEMTPEEEQLLWNAAKTYINARTYNYDLYQFEHRDSAEACSKKKWQCEKDFQSNRQQFKQALASVPFFLKTNIIDLGEFAVSEPIRNPKNNQWTVVVMNEISGSSFPEGQNPGDWLKEYAASALPGLQELKTDPAIRTQYDLDKISDITSLNAALSSKTLRKDNIETRLPKGDTLLTRAISLYDANMLSSLLKNGANPSHCAIDCPLTLAVSGENKQFIQQLLKFGANPNGDKNHLSPLMAAAKIADRKTTELLFHAGADPLQPWMATESYQSSPKSLLYFATTKNTAYNDWLQGKINLALEKTGKYKWTAWIEQDGKRKKVTDKAVITLKKAPFNIVMQFDAVNAVNAFRLLASEDQALLMHAHHASFRAKAIHGDNVGAASDDNKALFLGMPVKEDGEWKFDGAAQELGYTTNADAKTGTQLVISKNGPEYVFHVNETLSDSKAQPVQQLKSKLLAMVLGLVPNIGAGADYYHPACFKLKFE